MSDLSWLDSLPSQAQRALLTEVRGELASDTLAEYRPYPKQRLFHAAGATHRERLLRAGNQQGKTLSASREVAMHLTGLYPPWWQGRVFRRPIMSWASGETAEATRDNAQRALLGLPGEIGSGAIPRRTLGEYGMAMGTADLYDYMRIRHASGGASMLRFKYYAQGRRKWQGPPVDVMWFDEEPPEDIYDEGLARTIATRGIAALTFTPLLGMSAVVARFLMQTNPDRIDVNMTIEDAEHIPAEERERIIRSFPAHEREARARGVPTLGSGRIFPVEEERLIVTPFALPAHWVRIAGIDFGWDHPTAVVWLAWDRDTDTVYVTDCYRAAERPMAQHASAIRAKGAWIPVAWPHDGNNDTAAGPRLAQQYRDEAVAMLFEHAQFPESSHSADKPQSRVSVEAGVSEMYQRMESGRWRVFAHCHDWLEEFRLYHRDNGRIVKQRDDALDASRYALMMLRHAISAPREDAEVEGRRFNGRLLV